MSLIDCLFKEQLDERLVELHRYAWAKSTTATRSYQWKKYVDFCQKLGICPIPMNVHYINLFLLHLAIHGLTYTSINNQVSALVGFAKLYRQPIDIRGDYELDLTLRSLKRVLGDAQSRKDELFPAELMKMYRFVDQNDYVQESVWLGIVLLYRTMLYKSHIFSGEFDDNLLIRSEVQFCDWGVLIMVNRSKTIQYKEGA